MFEKSVRRIYPKPESGRSLLMSANLYECDGLSWEVDLRWRALHSKEILSSWDSLSALQPIHDSQQLQAEVVDKLDLLLRYYLP